jgi:hypothetical protein
MGGGVVGLRMADRGWQIAGVGSGARSTPLFYQSPGTSASRSIIRRTRDRIPSRGRAHYLREQRVIINRFPALLHNVEGFGLPVAGEVLANAGRDGLAGQGRRVVVRYGGLLLVALGPRIVQGIARAVDLVPGSPEPIIEAMLAGDVSRYRLPIFIAPQPVDLLGCRAQRRGG